MTTSPDILGRLNLVVDRLNDADIPATVEPSEVNVPGAWVDFTGVVDYTLRGYMVACEVVVMVPANDRRTTLAALQDILDEVVEVLGIPDGDVRKQSTTLGDGPTAYPSLVLPYLIA